MGDNVETKDPSDLIKKQLKLIDKEIFVQIVYESGFWCYILHKLPNKESIEFADSGECPDGDLWKSSDQLNNDWMGQEYKSFLEALANGIEEATNRYL